MRIGQSKKQFTSALTLTLSPGERGQRSSVVGYAGEARTNSSPRLTESRRMILPLLGKRAGVRESLCLFVVVLFCATSAFAQYAINWHTIDGGGGTSTGGVYSVSGTIGQPDASQQTMTGGNYSLQGGFWALYAVQTEGAPTLTIVSAGPNLATISWSPATGTNWVLQESSNLSPANWSNSPSGSANPVALPASDSMKFYRLFKP
jgi:hypothetical protein